ncbi:hypothetical protein GQX73_g8825 [Xylaria multiplex]|uniref:Aminoacyl-tRNA synthetase class II (D/K/N) domain-containing protein n=1 Tax=Xylaria multiplex TaxID=323545 RepID=A0A7C8INU1_9PEZI|nr:hypothetical protein GQX73_g8825 [Xylaria multiplex]
MGTPREKALGAIIGKMYGASFYIVDKLPESAPPFYAVLDPKNPKVTSAFDFFMRGQAILSDSQRIHLPGILKGRIRAKGFGPRSLRIKEYLDIFKSAGVPGMGVEALGWIEWYRGFWASQRFVLLHSIPELLRDWPYDEAQPSDDTSESLSECMFKIQLLWKQSLQYP